MRYNSSEGASFLSTKDTENISEPFPHWERVRVYSLFGKYQHIGNQPLSVDGAIPFMYTIVLAPACASIQKTFYLSLAALQRLDVLCLCSLNPAVAAIISG